MATPHVAGVAAILKQRHPALGRRSPQGGDHRPRRARSAAPPRSRSAQAVSTHEPAIAPNVVSTGSLEPRLLPVPADLLAAERGRSPTRTSAPRRSRLLFAVAGADGGEAPAGVSRLTLDADLPAGRRRAADVVLDPDRPRRRHLLGRDRRRPGRWLAGAFGLRLRSRERALRPYRRAPAPGGHRDGPRTSSRSSRPSNGDYEQRALAGPGTQTTTFRVPPGTYSVAGLTSGLAADHAEEGVFGFELGLPSVEADDEGRARRRVTRQFDVVTDRPAPATPRS